MKLDIQVDKKYSKNLEEKWLEELVKRCLKGHEFDFEVEKAGRYQVNAIMGYFHSGGCYQASVDGREVGRPRDYSFQGEDTGWDGFDLHDFEPGRHTLSFKCVGTGKEQRTQDPAHRALRVNAIILLRLQDIEGYRAVHDRLLGQKK